MEFSFICLASTISHTLIQTLTPVFLSLRFLRNQDRALHSESYPSLSYPELYLLEGGYKAFYEAHCPSLHCEPPRYTPMLHADHAADLRHFRAKSKSWGGERRRRERGGNCCGGAAFACEGLGEAGWGLGGGGVSWLQSVVSEMEVFYLLFPLGMGNFQAAVGSIG